MRILLLLLALVAAEPDPHPGVADPLAYVEAGYARAGQPSEALDRVASDRLRAELYAHDEAAGGEEVGSIDWWTDGREARITHLSLRREAGRDPARQAVAARFRNFGRPVALRFQFVRERGAWRLDEVANQAGPRSWTLTALLRLRPGGPGRPSGWDRIAEGGGGIHDPWAFLVYNYAAYQRGDETTPPLIRAIDSPRLRALFVAYDAAASPDEVGALDFDWWANGQDWSISDVAMTEEEGGPHRRVIAVRFRNFTRDTLTRFHFVEQGGRWFLDDVVNADWTLSALLRRRP